MGGLPDGAGQHAPGGGAGADEGPAAGDWGDRGGDPGTRGAVILAVHLLVHREERMRRSCVAVGRRTLSLSLSLSLPHTLFLWYYLI